jgi:pimeloyl-ACP methyl ester carboxylesterase
VVFERRFEGDPARPLVVLLHGVPVTSSVYELLAAELRARIPNGLALVDLPGLGRSRVEGEVDWSSQRAVLGAWLRAQGPVILVVHDVAGPVALPLLDDKDIDVRGLVLLNTILVPSDFRPVFTMRLLRAPVLGWVAAGITPRWFYLDRLEALGIARPERVDRALLERIHSETTNRGRWRDLHRALRGFELDGRTDRAIAAGLAALRAPCVAVWAPADPSLGDERRHLERLAPDCPLRTLPGARHFAMLDHAPELAALLVEAGLAGW